VIQAVQLAGAAAILAAFILAQLGVVNPRAIAYLVPNLVGAAALTVVAWHEEQWGFFLLEAVWTVVSAWGLAMRTSRGSSRRPSLPRGRSRGRS
jgi:hypothetical protein